MREIKQPNNRFVRIYLRNIKDIGKFLAFSLTISGTIFGLILPLVICACLQVEQLSTLQIVGIIIYYIMWVLWLPIAKIIIDRIMDIHTY